MLSQCLWCKKGTASDADIILCFGCEKSYHGTCCSLSRSSVKIIREVESVKWFCQHCDESNFASMINKRFNIMDEKIDKISNDNQYQELLNRMNSLSNEVLAIKLVVDSTNSDNSDEAMEEAEDEVFRPKRFRSGRTKQRSTSNLSTWPLLGPSKHRQCITGTDVSSTLKVIEPKVWFHVSRFGPETTADDLKSYVSGKISSEAVECYPLVPKGRDQSTLRFVTFKIGVLSSTKSALMDASIWPTNVSVRPFEERSGFQPPKYAQIPHRPHID